MTPTVFKALHLSTRSTADPEALLRTLASSGPSAPACVNDLEPPAFTVMPSLASLKNRLAASGLYDVVFMSGSGSTLVCLGSDEVPPWVAEEGLFSASGVRLTTREPGKWYDFPAAHRR